MTDLELRLQKLERGARRDRKLIAALSATLFGVLLMAQAPASKQLTVEELVVSRIRLVNEDKTSSTTILPGVMELRSRNGDIALSTNSPASRGSVLLFHSTNASAVLEVSQQGTAFSLTNSDKTATLSIPAVSDPSLDLRNGKRVTTVTPK